MYMYAIQMCACGRAGAASLWYMTVLSTLKSRYNMPDKRLGGEWVLGSSAPMQCGLGLCSQTVGDKTANKPAQQVAKRVTSPPLDSEIGVVFVGV